VNVCVFCSAREVPDRFRAEAAILAGGIAEAGHTLVWGGTDLGLMKVCADAAASRGGRLVGVSMEPLRPLARPDADEMIIAPGLAERKALYLQRSDILVALAGGIGTLDEVTEMLMLKQLGTHERPVVVINTDGLYDGLAQQLRTMGTLGFLRCAVDDLVTFVESAHDALATIDRAATGVRQRASRR
jgi:uncharacterized protein (TIGR00730 family)